MTYKKTLVSLVAVIALAVFSIAFVSATESFGDIVGLEVNEVDVISAQQNVAVTAGDTLSVRVFFRATENIEDVRVKAWIAGEKEFSSVTKETAVLEGDIYSWLLNVKVPSTLDEEELDEEIELHISIESREDGLGDAFSLDLTLQRESNLIEILDVDMENEVNAGDVLTFDVVVKNRGRQQSEDTFVVARIPVLKLEDRAYFGDLSPKDQDDPDKSDSNERRLSFEIPANTPAGVYVVEIEASNEDASTMVTKRIVVGGMEDKIQVVAPIHSRSFESGESAEYTLVLVNSGNQVGVFELVIETPTGLSVKVSEPVIAVPAGTSRTVQLEATAQKAGTYNFAVNVHSDGELVTREEFVATVEGANSESLTKTNPTVLLTVVLAVIFVVLLIVLIVLLTRKPEKSEEFGESYY